MHVMTSNKRTQIFQIIVIPHKLILRNSLLQTIEV